MKILVVDDDHSNRETLCFLLLRSGHDVIPADNAELAFEIAQDAADIDLIISDQDMPGDSGTEFFLKISKIKHPARRFLMSGRLHDVTIEDGKLVGVEEFLEKPVVERLRELGILKKLAS